MAFASQTTFLSGISPASGSFPAALHIPATAACSAAGFLAPWKSPFTSNFLLHCHPISTAPIQDNILNNFPGKDAYFKEATSERIGELITLIRSMLQRMDSGEISISPYDTAWVALVEDIGGGVGPQFPSSLEWIANNQHADGSWGDRNTFLVHDRILNTLACVVALTYWKAHTQKCNKGISFIRENIYKLEDEQEEHMLNGFEVVFPTLIEKAKQLNIDVPTDFPALKTVYARKDLKFSRIPWDMLHTVPTTLLFSLEGIADGLDWQKLLKLQFANGSFCYSPSSTAAALQETKDEKCLNYLLKLVQKFNGGVPNVYPLDMFEHNWAVDRLQRLGISRYFEPEIEQCLNYVHREWSNYKGLYSASNSKIQDVDDTAMGFRVLRLHGYDVSPDAFKQFENGGEFFCFAGQTSQAVTGMYNLYRASQVMFPGEKLLVEANRFSAEFLQEKRASNKIIDKWVITKELAGEVGYALDVPWYASLPRVEARFYIEQYGGEDDVWIGKTLYRIPYVNNNSYLELAKLDYNNCQALHQKEWKSIQQWYQHFELGEIGLSERSLLLAYYIAAASVFEPETSRQRLAWAKTTSLVNAVASQQLTKEEKRDFVREFKHGNNFKNVNGGRYKTRDSLVRTLIRNVDKLSLDTLLTQNKDIRQKLFHTWQKWLEAWEEGADEEAMLLVQTLNLFSGLDESSFSHPKYEQLLELTIRVCQQLRICQNTKEQEIQEHVTGNKTTLQINTGMQELVKLVLVKSSGDLNTHTKQSFLAVARSFYYATHCSPETIDFHIAKVLFERVA